jgi:aspartate racemase
MSSFGHGAQLMNMFGQTETTGIVTVYPIPASSSETRGIVPVGRPIANTRIYLLDASRRPVPVGVYGDVYIGGAGIGRGIWPAGVHGRRFVPDPFS